MKCPHCEARLRVMGSAEIEEHGKKYRVLKLYCKTDGCPENNGQPVRTERVEVNDGNQ